MRHWELGKSDAYISKEQIKMLNDAERETLKNFKGIYNTGKRGNVFFFVPKTMYRAMDILSDPQIRIKAGVNPDNNYVFASTKSSLHHVEADHDIAAIVKVSGTENEKFTAVKVNGHFYYA